MGITSLPGLYGWSEHDWTFLDSFVACLCSQKKKD